MTSSRVGWSAAASLSRIVRSTDISYLLAGLCQSLWALARPEDARCAAAMTCARTRLRPYLQAMKLDSKYFDCVRVKPIHEQTVHERGPVCQWRGCQSAGHYRAPKGRGREGQY